jgi:hypothetical protein
MERNMDYTTSANLGDGTDTRGIEALTPQELTVVQAPKVATADGVRISAYKQGGTVVVYADGLDPNDLDSPRTRTAAYEYRLGVGLGNAGMEALGGLFPLDTHTKPNPASLFSTKEVNEAIAKANGQKLRVYRQEFRLTPGL